MQQNLQQPVWQLRLLPAAATVKAVGGASNDASAAGGDTAAAGDAADEGGKVLEDMADINGINKNFSFWRP